MNVDKVISDEPLYEAISDLDRYDKEAKEGGKGNWKHSLFVAFASAFTGVAVWNTLQSGKDKHGLEWWESLVIVSAVTLVLGLTALVSRHARCTVSLMLPVLFSGLGRSILRALIISLVVSGPLTNILDNGLLLATSIECSAELTLNQANTTAQATIDILNQQIASVGEATKKLNEASRKMEEYAQREMVQALEEEDANGHLSPSRMFELGSKQCHENSDQPRMRCGVGINASPDQCNQISTNNDGCSQIKENDLEDENRKYTEDIKASIAGFGKQFKEPNLTLTSDKKVEINALKLDQGFKDTIDGVMIVGSIVSWISWLVSVTLLCLVIVKSITHQIKFLTKLSYMNNVVTSDLERLDASLPTLHRTFPLPTYMHTYVRFGKRKFITGEEFKLILLATLRHAIFFMLLLIVVLLDFQVYGVLEDISDTGYIVYEVYLTIGVLMRSDGGKWTKPVMDSIPQVNDLHHLSFTQENNECLPDANPPDQERTICILVFMIIIIVFNVLEIYSARAVRRLCVWFYPEREAQRVKFLYRFLKQRRNDCFGMLVEDKRGNLPNRSWLGNLAIRFFGHSCVICGVKSEHHQCMTCFGHGYDIVHCLDCWSDANNKCLFCTTTQDMATVPDIAILQLSDDSDYETEDDAVPAANGPRSSYFRLNSVAPDQIIEMGSDAGTTWYEWSDTSEVSAGLFDQGQSTQHREQLQPREQTHLLAPSMLSVRHIAPIPQGFADSDNEGNEQGSSVEITFSTLPEMDTKARVSSYAISKPKTAKKRRPKKRKTERSETPAVTPEPEEGSLHPPVECILSFSGLDPPDLPPPPPRSPSQNSIAPISPTISSKVVSVDGNDAWDLPPPPPSRILSGRSSQEVAERQSQRSSVSSGIIARTPPPPSSSAFSTSDAPLLVSRMSSEEVADHQSHKSLAAPEKEARKLPPPPPRGIAPLMTSFSLASSTSKWLESSGSRSDHDGNGQNRTSVGIVDEYQGRGTIQLPKPPVGNIELPLFLSSSLDLLSASGSEGSQRSLSVNNIPADYRRRQGINLGSISVKNPPAPPGLSSSSGSSEETSISSSSSVPSITDSVPSPIQPGAASSPLPPPRGVPPRAVSSSGSSEDSAWQSNDSSQTDENIDGLMTEVQPTDNTQRAGLPPPPPPRADSLLPAPPVRGIALPPPPPVAPRFSSSGSSGDNSLQSTSSRYIPENPALHNLPDPTHSDSFTELRDLKTESLSSAVSSEFSVPEPRGAPIRPGETPSRAEIEEVAERVSLIGFNEDEEWD